MGGTSVSACICPLLPPCGHLSSFTLSRFITELTLGVDSVPMSLIQHTHRYE